MTALQSAMSSVDRAKRSVFVGNIPLNTTEEHLKNIFSRVGPVVTFKFLCDKESGKNKGYGFCEYKEPEMALSATRNLNGYELNGRTLRVDNVASEKCREELKNLQAMDSTTTEASNEPDPERAPEEISKAVASLPPEQMFELMKQMKLCIQNNPNEARNLLLQNPQLAYAILQAQVVMKIVDPNVALSILNRPLTAVPSQVDGDPNHPSSSVQSKMPVPEVSGAATYPQSVMPPNQMVSGIPSSASNIPAQLNLAMGNPQVAQSFIGSHPAMVEQNRPPNQFLERGMFNVESLRDPRSMGDLDLRLVPGDHDMRVPQGMMMGDKDMRQMGDVDFRQMPQAPVADNRPFDPRFRGRQGGPSGQAPGGFDRQQPAGPVDPRTYDNRGMPRRMEDPRSTQPAARPGRTGAGYPAAAAPFPPGAPGAPVPLEQDKAALILQVLQLSDQQIAMLPAEQRQSIMMLKEQIARGQTQ